MSKYVGVARSARLAAARAKIFEERQIAVNTNFVLGRCVPSVKNNAAKICVTQLIFNDKIKAVSYQKKSLQIIFLYCRH